MELLRLRGRLRGRDVGIVSRTKESLSTIRFSFHSTVKDAIAEELFGKIPDNGIVAIEREQRRKRLQN
ncbi:hypothetical protein Sjap_004403 [Stephania japonica]|uniref:Uncharacterized protein n=1 Tax=Stephania japonica TaxID=461633 RepID=A0AAP0K371_9MAGN